MERIPKLKSNAEKAVDQFSKYEATASPDIFGSAYVIQFHFKQEGVMTTLRILFDDQTGSDVVITNMTTLPEVKTGKGYGSKAVQSVIAWAQDNNLNEIRATQVESSNEKFWIKNGFTKITGENKTNDFIYKINSIPSKQETS